MAPHDPRIRDAADAALYDEAVQAAAHLEAQTHAAVTAVREQLARLSAQYRHLLAHTSAHPETGSAPPRED